MIADHLLSLMILLPIFCIIGLYIFSMIKQCSNKFIWATSWICMAIETYLAFLLWKGFDFNNLSMQFIEKYEWIPAYNIHFALGVDGISLPLIFLTTFLSVICLIFSAFTVKKEILYYVTAFLFLQSAAVGVFAATDLVLFYICFDAVLIPMFILIGIYGGENKLYASFKLFLYTFSGSVLMFIAIVYLWFATGSADISQIASLSPFIDEYHSEWLWIAFFIAFAIKIPMWPFHTWLPDAHVQAPTAGSVMLAGVLLKLGGYGMIRILLAFFPEISLNNSTLIFILSAIAVVYTSLVALMQEDMKKLIAYSSVAHMGFVTAGIFSMTQQGLDGAMFQMISHGLISGGLFLCVGFLYERMHTKEIAAYGGIVNKMPRFALYFMILTLASIGLPGTSGFIGELLVLIAAFNAEGRAVLPLASGMVLGAAYMLWLYKRLCFGNIRHKKISALHDLSISETISIVPLILMIIYLGIYPKGLSCYISGFNTIILENIKQTDKD